MQQSTGERSGSALIQVHEYIKGHPPSRGAPRCKERYAGIAAVKTPFPHTPGTMPGRCECSARMPLTPGRASVKSR